MSVTQVSLQESSLQEYLNEVCQGIYTEDEFRELQESSLYMNALAGNHCKPKETGGMEDGQLRTTPTQFKTRSTATGTTVRGKYCVC
jgi:hypothetical protein